MSYQIVSAAEKMTSPGPWGHGYQTDWYFVDITKDGMTNNHDPVPFIDSHRRHRIQDWCVNNCNKKWAEKNILTYVFESEEESVLFALTWC